MYARCSELSCSTMNNRRMWPPRCALAFIYLVQSGRGKNATLARDRRGCGLAYRLSKPLHCDCERTSRTFSRTIGRKIFKLMRCTSKNRCVQLLNTAPNARTPASGFWRDFMDTGSQTPQTTTHTRSLALLHRCCGYERVNICRCVYVFQLLAHL